MSIGKSSTGALEGMMDVIFCPAGPGPAPPLNGSKYWGCTSQWNLLDYPAVVLPVTTFDSTVDQWPKDWTALNEQDQYNRDLCRLINEGGAIAS